MTLVLDDILYRISLGLYFILFYKSGLEKVFHFAQTVKEIRKKVYIFSQIATLTTIIVILLELIAPTYIIIDPFNSLESQILAFALIGFMLLIIFFFHNPVTQDNQFANFLNTMYLTMPLFFIAYIAQ